MNVINNIIESNAVSTALCTIVEGNMIQASATTVGNALECTTKNEMLQTVAKTLQSVPTAFLSVWATWNLADVFGEFSSKYMNIVNYTSLGLAALVMSMPLIFQAGKYLSPENKEKIENFQKNYSTALKIVNILTAGIALGSFAVLGAEFIIPALLSSASLISSGYALYSDFQTSEAQ